MRQNHFQHKVWLSSRNQVSMVLQNRIYALVTISYDEEGASFVNITILHL